MRGTRARLSGAGLLVLTVCGTFSQHLQAVRLLQNDIPFGSAQLVGLGVR